MDIRKETVLLQSRMHSIRMKSGYKALGDEKIHPGQLFLLHTLNHMGCSSQRELSQAMHSSPAAVGVSVKRLEKNGYLKKLADESDLRKSKVMLTEEGKRVATECERLMNEMMHQMLLGFSDEEVEALNGYLKRMCDNMERFRVEQEENRGYDF